MGLRSRRDASMIWPGFVDAVTTLLMVLMFVLTIFTVMQAVLRDTINTQSDELDSLTDQLAQLADALGMQKKRADGLQAQVGQLTTSLTEAQAEGARQASLIASLTTQLTTAQGDLADAQGKIASFEAQVASLLAERDTALGRVDDLETAQAKLLSEQEAMELALAKARTEVDAQSEQARLAAARREALEALLAQLRREKADAQTAAQAATEKLTAEEEARLADAAALQALRDKLKNSDDELMAMTLALEEQRKRAEETLTLLAAAQTEAAKNAASEKDAALAAAKLALSEEQEKSLEAARKVALLNEQIAALRGQLASLQQVLDAAAAKDAAAKVQIEALGSQLNSALAQVAAEQKARAESLEAQNADLAKFRSEFFGQLSQLLAGREGVRVVGDRFVFSSEVLFNAGAADLAPEGRDQIAGVVQILNEIKDQIPEGIDWIIRVDGHTDNQPMMVGAQFADNWELSQARALSVVRYMQDELGFPPDRMAATGFGEYRPVATGDTPEALAQNRRIELKLTER